jgi:SAM-dependent methyltransferase
MEPTNSELRNDYDPIAAEYAKRLYHELDHKPLDRALLERLAAQVGELGPICDLGCGPGQVAAYLHSRGAQVCGIDLSAEMVRQARQLNPEINFQQGNMLALTDMADQAFGGIAAFYSIIHIPRELVVAALREMWRCLRPQGLLLLTFHLGQQVIQFDELWEQPVALDFIFFETAEMTGYLTAANFELEEVIERDPYPEVEVQTRRAYIFARKL